MITAQQIAFASHLWDVTNFCYANRGSRCLRGDLQKMFRYVAFCHLTGKIAVSQSNGQIDAVVFYWADWREHLESRIERGLSVFEWRESHPGDCLFVGDVVGNRQAV